MFSTSLIRKIKAGGAGLGVSFALFYLMSQLISGGQNLNKSDDSENFIEFVRIKKEDMLQERKRELPKKPPEPKKPPPPQKMSLAADEPSKPQMNMDLPKMDTALKGSGPYLGPGGSGGGSGVTPIVRLDPEYPRKAAMQGIQGWVRLRFDITAMGTVENVQVLEAEPRRVFDMSAKRALLKWKYRPKMEDGKPVPQKGEMVQLDFKLE